MNIPKPRIKLLIVIAAAGLVFAEGLTWWLAKHDNSAKQQPTAQTTPAESQATTNTPEPSATNPTPAQTNTSTTKPNTTTPAPAPQPAPANITHPTAANCPTSGEKITVYASVESGTPAYLDHPVYRDSSNKVVKTYEYKTAITNVFCDDNRTALFSEVGRQNYYRFNFSDVSVTLP